jgi:ribosomal protein L18
MATVKDLKRAKIKARIRSKVSGTAERPRMSVFRSNKEIYVHRIIWKYVHGVEAPGHINHLDGDCQNNRLNNLSI